MYTVRKSLTSQHQHSIACNNQHFELTANRVRVTIVSKLEVDPSSFRVFKQKVSGVCEFRRGDVIVIELEERGND